MSRPTAQADRPDRIVPKAEILQWDHHGLPFTTIQVHPITLASMGSGEVLAWVERVTGVGAIGDSHLLNSNLTAGTCGGGIPIQIPHTSITNATSGAIRGRLRLPHHKRAHICVIAFLRRSMEN